MLFLNGLSPVLICGFYSVYCLLRVGSLGLPALLSDRTLWLRFGLIGFRAACLCCYRSLSDTLSSVVPELCLAAPGPRAAAISESRLRLAAVLRFVPAL